MGTPHDESHAEIPEERQDLLAYLQQPVHLLLLSHLAGRLSHEMRNPLTTIFLHVDILGEALQQGSQAQAAHLLPFVHTLRQEAQRLETLIQPFLWLLRLPDLPRHPTDLGAWLSAFARDMQPWLAARQLSLEVHSGLNLGSILVHQATFHRLLRHLLENAAAAMPQGGVIRLGGERLGQRLCLEVQDTGNGLLSAQFPALLQPFATSKAQAVGLGLYLAKAIALAHEGDLAVQSTPGVGTVVRLTFPGAIASSPTPHSPTLPVPGRE